MNDDDKKMLEEVEKFMEAAAPGPPWLHASFAHARSLLPALAKRLRSALEEIERREATANSQADDEEALNLASAGFETARREAIAAIKALPEWPIVAARMKRDAETDRIAQAYPVKEDEGLFEYVDRVVKAETDIGATESPVVVERGASPFPLSSRNLTPSDELKERLEAAKTSPPMTPERLVEQKISWVFGQNAIENENHLSKREVAGVVYEKAFREVLADLRVAVIALEVLKAQSSNVARAALKAIKTRGL